MKNAHILSGLNTMTRGISPTFFQQSLLPKWAQGITDVVHDGIDTEWLKPDKNASLTVVDSNKKTLKLTTNSPVVTFVNRTFEPYRGIHIFLEAIRKLQTINSNAIVLLVGNDQPNVSYGKNREDGVGWLTYLRKCHGKNLDWDRIFYLGLVPHNILRNVYQISSAHVYLSYPFVLSWSMLEAMSCGALILASDTKPVREIITDQTNGLLVPFKDHEMLATLLAEAINSGDRFHELRKNARRTIISNYKLDLCINKQMQIIDSLG
jgi:glycosyltransferase involved in cell wall biosynthesis